MNPRMMKILSSLLILLFAISSNVFAEGKDVNKLRKVKSTQEIMGSPSRTHFNINNISTWIYNNGDSDIQPNGNSGFIYPKGSNKAAVFESGFVWGAEINGEKRVGGSTYGSGLLPGSAIGSGASAEGEDPALDHVRIYRVRTDWNADGASFSAEIADGEGSATDIKAQYEKDWNEWPAEYGAPYEDVDGDGSYDPEEDIPGFVGADQTIWYVANDLDEDVVTSLYGSASMGVEMQATFWGYRQAGAIGNIMFRKYKIINKGVNNFDSMYVSMWSDPDLGDAGDDFSGCDTSLSMMYTYNGNANDGVYGNNPPAIGFDFFQGPVVASPGDTAIVNGQLRPDFKNLPMSAHYFFINSDAIYTDPDLGDYEGTLQFHRLFRGEIPSTGAPFTDPNTGIPTKFTLAGDPVTGTGWIDGQIHEPGDRRQGMVAGPFFMAVGDTQEVVVAELVGGGTPGIDNLTAVTVLKSHDRIAQSIYDNFFNLPSAPPSPIVNVVNQDKSIILDWGEDLAQINATESSVVPGIDNIGEFKFQGYNVYQLPYRDATFDEAKRIATFDVIDGVKVIMDEAVDTQTGKVVILPAQYGSDSGVKRSIEITKDAFKNAELQNGTEYYFAVLAYSFNDSTHIPNNLENPLQKVTAIPQKAKPGFEVGEEFGSSLATSHEGTADASAVVNVVNPNSVTGDSYEVYFNQQHYYLASDGMWHETNYADSIGKKLSKDVSPAYLSGLSYVASSTTRDLKFTIHDLEAAPDYSYCDGVVLTFPAGIEILSAQPSGAGGPVPGIIDGQTVTWGAEDTTKNGPFHGGEVLTVTVKAPTLPLDVAYLMWDDGWGWLSGADYGIVGEYKHATGTVTVSEETNYFRTENHWNVKNTNTNDVVIEKQRVFGGIDIYASFWNALPNLGENDGPSADGLQFTVDGGFAPPVGIFAVDSKSQAEGTYDIDDYGVYGWAATGRSIDAFGNGLVAIEDLQKDYELRYTGVYEDADANGVVRVKEGTGSMATLYGARGYALADNPLNPNPGTDAPFLIRVPFEVWNVDDGVQVNLLVYDRLQSATDNPFYAFNPVDRMYCEINNTPYDATYTNSGDPENSDTDNLTWNLIFWTNEFVTGDVVKISYANPIQIGKDVFTFDTKNVEYSAEKAKVDVKKINVFPNPYYGVNPNEINKYQRYVTFNHLPNKAVLRIFNLAGQLVRTLEKDDASQYLKWDLQNENALPVASGMYIVHVDMPEIGETKILKAAIIQETQILDRY